MGGNLFRLFLKTFPFLWSPKDGFRVLPLPCPGPPLRTSVGVARAACTGNANDISADGRMAVGVVRRGLFPPVPSQAASWSIRKSGSKRRPALRLLETPDPWSDALAVSADGSVIVGGSGPSETELAAARWVDGVRRPLEPVGHSSSAQFVSDDGRAAVGMAELPGQRVLVRWDDDGVAMVTAPPARTTLDSIRAINAAATVAVGALSEDGNRAPYIWTISGGFTVLPEMGLEREYDLSEALGVSGDGGRVVGALQLSIQSDTSPKSAGFLWTPSAGLILINDLLEAAGHANPGVYFALAISSNGRRILVTGDPPRSSHDTNSLIIELSPP